MKAVLAIDGGNSKTDIALVAADGAVLARGRGPGFVPHTVGAAAAVDTVARAVAALGVELPPGTHTAACVAGADLPEDEIALGVEFRRRGLGVTVAVANDTFAVLRAGATHPWGVVVVCGAGVNALGVAPDGRVARFPSLGRLTGDWGGGEHLGEEVLWHAVRAEDGRGPGTALAAPPPPTSPAPAPPTPRSPSTTDGSRAPNSTASSRSSWPPPSTTPSRPRSCPGWPTRSTPSGR
ncbi:BadF/BadG/BcrA/BcrD ATPase family protein [Actinokineospora soli]|uniref:BadF/BadG/BcrA/BcrD ATPase family protein n=1 Tax=Actinokineospora soli TaxID=1048753 RepID=A0ABW2TPZ2_9PSEU